MRGSAAHSRRDPQYLFECWPGVAARVRSARAVALFLDFDGTLAPFRKRPDQVRMSERTRGVLRRLVRCPAARVLVLSGRRRADVQGLVGVPEVRCFGLHGWEGSEPARSNASVGKMLRRARKEFEQRLAPIHKVWIEQKGPVFAVHVRGASEDAARRAGNIVSEVIRWFAPDLRLLPGNRVWEIIPAGLKGKGAAALALLNAMKPAPLPIFVGDDTTDESAFAALREGITVCVGARRPTEARFTLHGPPEVRQFLARLERQLRERRLGIRRPEEPE
jgi:trehalose 6-phosphate phosphatase